jgi:hypothetical protein
MFTGGIRPKRFAGPDGWTLPSIIPNELGSGPCGELSLAEILSGEWPARDRQFPSCLAISHLTDPEDYRRIRGGTNL